VLWVCEGVKEIVTDGREGGAAELPKKHHSFEALTPSLDDVRVERPVASELIVWNDESLCDCEARGA
jgi:hypothetical protein